MWSINSNLPSYIDLNQRQSSNVFSNLIYVLHKDSVNLKLLTIVKLEKIKPISNRFLINQYKSKSD